MALRTPEKPDEYNPTSNESQDNFDNIVNSNFSPDEQRVMKDGAIDSAADGIKNGSNSTAEDLLDGEQNVDSTDKNVGSLEDKENGGDTNWSTNVSSKGTRKVKGITKNGKMMIVMFGLLFAGIGLIFSIVSGAMGIVQIKENMLSKMSQRGADALEKRKARIMAKKFSQDITRGICTSGVKIKCRYRGMSEREIKKFNKRASRTGSNYKITSDGRSVSPLKKSISIEFTDPKSGNTRTISASEFKSLIKTDPEFRKAFNEFYKGNVQYHAGRAGSFVLAKYKVYRGKIKAPKGEGDSDEIKRKYSLRKMLRQAGAGITGSLEAKKIATDGATNPGEVDPSDSVSDDVKNIVDEDVNREKNLINDFDQDGNTPTEGSDAEQDRNKKNIDEKIISRGGGISGIVGNPLAVAQPICIARMIAAAASSAKGILQAIQLIRFSAQFAVLADQIKAGDADSETLEATGLLMGMLSTKDERGYTAFDSMGYNWVMSSSGAVKGTPNENIGRYQNGGYTAGTLGPAVTSVTSSSELKSICKVAMSKTAAVIGVGLVLIPGIGSIFKGGVGFASREVVKSMFNRSIKLKMDDIIDKQIAKTVLKQKLSTLRSVAGSEAMYSAFFYYGLPPLINSLSKSLAGTVVTGDEKGTDAGNALVSGFGATASQTGKAQGMMPLNPDRAVATDNFAYENQLKLAKEDGINQFDFTNRFSFANQFAVNILPLQAKFSSLTSLPTAISNISSSALSLSFSKSALAATDKKKQYTYCTDADEIYSEKNIATDPMCNPIYGIPAAAKDIDPEAVIDYLSGVGYIDEEGSPQGEFTEFIEKCLTSQTPYGDDDMCLKGGGLDPEANHLSDDDKKYAMMRLYCIDTSIDVDMNDGEGVSCIPKVESNSESNEATEEESTEIPSGDAKELARQILDSSNVDYSAGNFCRYCKEDLENTASGRPAYGSINIDVKILQFIYDLSKVMKVDINSITGAGSGHSSGSNHYKGTAVDFGCSMTDGAKMDEISSKYGIKTNYERCDAGVNHWHYSASGT